MTILCKDCKFSRGSSSVRLCLCTNRKSINFGVYKRVDDWCEEACMPSDSRQSGEGKC